LLFLVQSHDWCLGDGFIIPVPIHPGRCVHNIGPNIYNRSRSCYAKAESEEIVASLPAEARAAYCEPSHQEGGLNTGERPSEVWSAARVAQHRLQRSTSRCREAAGTCWSMAKVATRHLCGRFVGFGMSWYVSVRSSLDYLWRRDIKMPIRQLSRAPEREGARKGQRARRRVRGTCVSGAGMARVAAARRDAPLASWAAVRRQRSAWLWGRRSPRLAAATTTILRALRCCRRLGVDRRTSPSVQASPGATLRVAFERQGT
jgi:hypothetical protein